MNKPESDEVPMHEGAGQANDSLLERVNCPACGPADKTVFQAGGESSIVRCRSCGLLFLDPRLNNEANRHRFAHVYMPSVARVEREYISLRQSALRREADIIKCLVPAGGRLLDIGCGSGFFLSEFGGCTNWQVMGIEPSEVASAYAREHFQLDVHQGLFEDMPFPPDQFDVVTSLDTFYFFRSPEDVLDKIYSVLKPGGIFAVEIPNLSFRLAKVCAAWLISRGAKGFTIGNHYFFYSTESLKILARKRGFNFVENVSISAPAIGSPAVRGLKLLYNALSRALYVLSFKQLDLLPKAYIIFSKGSDADARS